MEYVNTLIYVTTGYLVATIVMFFNKYKFIQSYKEEIRLCKLAIIEYKKKLQMYETEGEAWNNFSDKEIIDILEHSIEDLKNIFIHVNKSANIPGLYSSILNIEKTKPISELKFFGEV